MRTFLLFLVAALVLSGCTTTPLLDSQSSPVEDKQLFAYQTEPSGEYGLISVKRDGGIFGSGCRLGVYIDGTLAARVGSSEIARFKVPVGERLIGVGPGGAGLCSMISLREQSILVKNKETKKFRISADMNSGAALTPTSLD